MISGKTVKLIVYEVLQFAALIVPVIVIMERFARVISRVNGQDATAYWLVVAVSIAYVTSVTLLVWVPLKVVILKQRRFITEITQWRPTALAYLILCTLPCFVIIMTSSKVDFEPTYDHFGELPVSLVLFSLICVDIIERIRPSKLKGKFTNRDYDLDMSGPVLTNLEQVTTVSAQLHTSSHEGLNGSTQDQPEARNGSVYNARQDLADSPRLPPPSPRTPNTAYLYYNSRPLTYSGPLHILWKKDGRSEVFVESFLFWLDTVEMLRVAGDPEVFSSPWMLPVYIFTFLSTFRFIITPHSSLLSFAGVALQDFPFCVIRIGLIAKFGFVTPLLYPLKNLLVSLTFIYFTFLTKLKIFSSQSMF
ncbi:transmembrane protein 236 isoform X1 [Cololabis saira]|uniref:transmembrane protein 236 isoform X1 n=1 Tax=Cololabis saira TaxID=129043 RepID=UPI002AD2B124|nr:transmembrane protein 236 isoform X1 [Cololabis saira]